MFCGTPEGQLTAGFDHEVPRTRGLVISTVNLVVLRNTGVFVCYIQYIQNYKNTRGKPRDIPDFGSKCTTKL
jgi:hypothetical protein